MTDQYSPNPNPEGGQYPYPTPENAPQGNPYAAQGGYAPYPTNNQNPEGAKLAQTSLIFGIVSIFIFGIIFGPLAISKASQAAKYNVDATAGKVTGWIGTIFGILGLLYAAFMIFILFAVGTTGY